MRTLSSTTNPEIKNVVQLHERTERHKQQLFIAQGARTIGTLKEAGATLQTLYCTHDTLAQAQSLVPDSHIVLLSTAAMNKISIHETASGLLAVYKIPPQPSQPLRSGLVLAQLSDPGNVGTLIRTSIAMNATSIVIVGGIDVWNPKVVQASAGTIGYAHIFHLSWHALRMQQDRPPLVALVAQDGTPLEQIPLDQALLVVGNEAHGLPASWVDDCAHHATISMPGKAESLNAAVAGSIALYELFKP